MATEPWIYTKVIIWSQILLNSYRQRVGKDLIELKGDATEQAKILFFAPLVVVSHGTEKDPILNYGNQLALELWGMSWEEFTRTPSRQTAEPLHREERQRMLVQAAQKGFIDNYQGIRISGTGKRFQIKQAIVWNLLNDQNKPCGQAATFSDWSFL